MSDLEKVMKTFDEVGIHYLLETVVAGAYRYNKQDSWTTLYICGEGKTLEEAKQYNHMIEFCNGELASF